MSRREIWEEMEKKAIIKACQDAVKGDQYFWSLCNPLGKMQKRPCSQCKKVFKSPYLNRRICDACTRRLTPRDAIYELERRSS